MEVSLQQGVGQKWQKLVDRFLMMVCLCGYSVGLGYFHQACDADLAFW